MIIPILSLSTEFPKIISNCAALSLLTADWAIHDITTLRVCWGSFVAVLNWWIIYSTQFCRFLLIACDTFWGVHSQRRQVFEPCRGPDLGLYIQGMLLFPLLKGYVCITKKKKEKEKEKEEDRMVNWKSNTFKLVNLPAKTAM